MIKHITRLFLLLTLCAAARAQVVDIPDLNLRAAIRGELQLLPGSTITNEDMLRLKGLDGARREITLLTGLEHAPNLTSLSLWGNPLTNLTPIANLERLTYLDIAACSISDITTLADLISLTDLNVRFNRIVDIGPITNLTNLVSLRLEGNRVVDIAPLANLTQLAELYLSDNRILDVNPLADLTRLETLDIQGNPVMDYTPLDGLALTDFLYDQFCELPPLPIHDRIKDRDYPSVFTAWAGPHWVSILNRPDLSGVENVAMHDLWFSVPQFGLTFRETSNGFTMAGSVDEAIKRRDEFLALNPNMLFIADIRMRSYALDEFPEDWQYWIKDSDGNIVNAWEGVYGLIDFTHPDIQDRIVQQAIAVSKCGLYDGIHFDWWSEDGAILADLYGDWSHKYRGNEAEQEARDNILRRIRAGTRSDFLIMGNTNRHTIPRTAPQINGGFMETLIPHTATGDHLEALLNEVETSLLWLEQNLREPQINALEGWGIPTKSPDDPTNLRWMRAFTTLSLTHSDGYVLFNLGEGHEHFWYDFWDADLGQPVGAKAQLYEDRPGLYIREFLKGWAVYNHSGESQAITLPEEAQGVASGLVNTEHTLPNLDGEMYLRKTVVSDQSPVADKNPADVNGDGVVNILDLTIVAQALGTDSLEGDVNEDGAVNVFDLVIVANEF